MKKNNTSWLKKHQNWIYGILLTLILLGGSSLRLAGLNWDENTYLHPDERGLLFVESAIEPVGSLSEYFDTGTSTLNPYNRGYNSFFYGTFPVFLVRYATEWNNQLATFIISYLSENNPDALLDVSTDTLIGNITDWAIKASQPPGLNEFKLVGRQLSTLADLLVVLLVFFVAERVYDKRVGLIAASLSTFAVLQIQLSNFFAVDTFVNLFILLSIYIATIIVTHKPREKQIAPSKSEKPEEINAVAEKPKVFEIQHFILFGLVFGLAMASKISAVVVAGLLPLAVLIRFHGFTSEERQDHAWPALYSLIIAGAASFVTFRIFQPYAFDTQGFFDLLSFDQPWLFNLNEKWLANMAEIRRFVSGEIDWPPSIQWARRPIWFSFQNLSLWGMGLPMSIAAWGGFLWVGWRMFKGEWQKHILLWGWTAAFFVWQSMAFNPMMRYQLPIYPTLAIFAAWGLVALWDKTAKISDRKEFFSKLARPAAITIAVVVLTGTFLWAYAFTRIYTTPIARIESSHWIYQNIPGPINLMIKTGDNDFSQPLPFPYFQKIGPNAPYSTNFVPKVDGSLSAVVLNHVVTSINLSLFDAGNLIEPLFTEDTPREFIQDGDSYKVSFRPLIALQLSPDLQYMLRFTLPFGVEADGLQKIELQYVEVSDQSNRFMLLEIEKTESNNISSIFESTFSIPEDSRILNIQINFVFDLAPQTFNLAIANTPEFSNLVATARQSIQLSMIPGGFNQGQVITLGQPLQVTAGETYYLRLSLDEGSLPVTLIGAAVANETSFDDGLPLRVAGYDGFGGIYQGELNFQVYWDDTANGVKLDRFLYTLNNAEYIFISSSRQWASTPRIPERYPLVSQYYRSLLGCPDDKSIEWCYNLARVGTFEGELGFELVQTFQTDPTIGSFSINDQPSEESFTVYDHPKVFIFQKSNSYDPEQVAALLGAVDLSNVIRLTPLEASGSPGSAPTLKLSEEQLASQQSGGTWSQLFDLDSLINRFQPLTVVIWYLAVSLLGIAVYPLVRIALPGLQDRGYPFSRAVGLLLLSYFSWMAGSIGLPFSRLTIAIIFGLLLILGGYLYYRNWEEFKQEWSEKITYFLRVEVIILVFFFAGLFIRFGNPDLWHAAKGGEKPMDFSYFNAVLKSTSFPPYDPWFAGGYINYYYYGFVYVGVLVKMLGIVPAIAYNLILPTLFSFIGIGGFSLGWNLISHRQKDKAEKDESDGGISPWFVGIAAALALAVLGNLGSLQMIILGFQKLGAFGLFTPDAGFFIKFWWGLRGMFEYLIGTPLPYSLGDWYWNPSRVIPGSVINEFPMFTILYADLHAHLIALPLTLLSIAWTLSVVFSQAWANYRSKMKEFTNWSKRAPQILMIGWSIALGALAVGALRPTNTWDYPTYLILGVVILIYAVGKYIPPGNNSSDPLAAFRNKILGVIGSVALFVGLSLVFYQPYAQTYVQGYNTIEPWSGEITPLGSYFVHWGLFLVVIISWFVWETRQWLASTPLSSLRKLEPYRYLIITFLIAIFGAVIILQVPFQIIPEGEITGLRKWVFGLIAHGTSITWLVLPLAAWSGILLLRPKISDAKRLVLFFIGTALILTLMVDVVIIDGVGRMNTVFKFYMQAWTLFALSSAAALGWILTEINLWQYVWRRTWQVAMVLLVAATALFPLVATVAKVRDRMSAEAPNTLDGMAYMQTATYGTGDVNTEQGVQMDLSQDYRAIQWMQANIQGSPVIVEANRPQYQWGSRFTVYTGLPGVLGWDWHQYQQRAFVLGNATGERVNQIREFYETENEDIVRVFLQTYNVHYIVFGQLERATYREIGFEKFDALEGVLWREVYRDQDTIIYEVIPAALGLE